MTFDSKNNMLNQHAKKLKIGFMISRKAIWTLKQQDEFK